MTVQQTNSSKTTGTLKTPAPTLKNPAIAKAIPGAIANEAFIHALFMEAHGRKAAKAELARFANTTVKDASNIILRDRSPFTNAVINRNAVPSAKSAQQALHVPGRLPDPPAPPPVDTSKVAPGKPKIAQTAQATPDREEKIVAPPAPTRPANAQATRQETPVGPSQQVGDVRIGERLPIRNEAGRQLGYKVVESISPVQGLPGVYMINLGADVDTTGQHVLAGGPQTKLYHAPSNQFLDFSGRPVTSDIRMAPVGTQGIRILLDDPKNRAWMEPYLPKPAHPTDASLAPGRPPTPPRAATAAPPAAPNNPAPAPVNHARARPVLNNPAIAAANPGVIANPSFINALYQEAQGRDANRAELDRWTGTPTYVKDAANVILGARSPFTHAEIDRGAVPAARSAEAALQAPSTPRVQPAPPPKREPVITVVEDRFARPGSVPVTVAESQATAAESHAPPAELAAPTLNNPEIAAALPGAIANENFINALYKEALGRKATALELGRWMDKPTYVKDAAAVILGDGSPFSNSVIDREAVPGARSAEAARLAPSTPTAEEIAAQKAAEERRKAEEQEAARKQAIRQYERLYEATIRLDESPERVLKEERKQLSKNGVSDEAIAVVEARVAQRQASKHAPENDAAGQHVKAKAAPGHTGAGAPPAGNWADEFDRSKVEAMKALKANLGKAAPPSSPEILLQFTRAAESLGRLDGPTRAASQRKIEDLADYLHFHRVADYSKLREICEKNDLVGEMKQASAGFDEALEKFGGQNTVLATTWEAKPPQLPAAQKPFKDHADAATAAIGAFLGARVEGKSLQETARKAALAAFENAATAAGRIHDKSKRPEVDAHLAFLQEQLEVYDLAPLGELDGARIRGIKIGESETIARTKQRLTNRIAQARLPSEDMDLVRALTPDVVERSDQFFYQSMDYNLLALKTLKFSETWIDQGEFDLAHQYLDRANRYSRIADQMEGAAADQLLAATDISQDLIVAIAASTGVKIATSLLGAPGSGVPWQLALSAEAGSAILSTHMKFAIDTTFKGVPTSEAQKDAIIGLIVDFIFMVPGIKNVIGEPAKKFVGKDSGIYQQLSKIIASPEVKQELMRALAYLAKKGVIDITKFGLEVELKELADQILTQLKAWVK